MKDFQILLSLLHSAIVECAVTVTKQCDIIGEARVVLSIVGYTPLATSEIIDDGCVPTRFSVAIEAAGVKLFSGEYDTVRAVWVSLQNWAEENGVVLPVQNSAFDAVVADVTLRNLSGLPKSSVQTTNKNA